MQQLSEGMQAHLAQEVTTLATCWSMTRKDGARYYFTDHDADIVQDGAIYRASSGVTPSAVSAQLGLAVDNLELEGMLATAGITESEILGGLFDHAAVEVWRVDYRAPEAGRLPMAKGWLGEMRLKGGSFVAEVRGISALLQQTVGEVYTAHCRAQLGDARCKRNLSGFTFTGTVDGSDAPYRFHDAARTQVAGYFAHGLVTFTSGANIGLSMEVREFAGGQFTLFLPMQAPIAPGDGYVAVAGCDKAFDTCVSRFNNAVNFRGEPHVPGTDRLLETSATRSK